jgi:large repetitive protein
LKNNNTRFKGIVLGAALVVIGVVCAIAGNTGTSVWADAGSTSACTGCHTLSTSLTITTPQPTLSVAAGSQFAVPVTWSGSSGRTEINWPNTLNNTQFAPNPRVPYSGSTGSGSTTSTLTAPATAGAYNVRVYIGQGSPLRTNYSNIAVTVTAASGPSVTTSSLPAGTVGTAYSQALAASGGTSPYSWSVTAGSLPAGLTLSTAGTISGTPTAAATSNFTVQVRDNAAQTGTRALSIVVNAAPATVSITTASLPGGTVGTAYSQALAASGGTAPYTWSVTTGSLPSGLTLSSAGVISGTPTAAATANFTVQARDSAARTATRALSIVVSTTPATVSVTTASLPNGMVGAAYSQALAAAGGTTPYTWSVTAGSLPSGLTLSSAGTISGTPASATTANFTVQVRDSAARTATRALSIIVSPASNPLTINTNAGVVGEPYSQSLAVSGGTPPYTWSVTTGSLPAGLALSTGGVISGTPAAGGSSTFTVQVADSTSASATRDLTIVITAPVVPLEITGSLGVGSVGTAYSETLTVSGGTAPYTWSISSGALPAGLAINNAGTVGGTPTTAGTSNFTVQVRDAAAGIATKALSITVSPPLPASLVIGTASLPAATTGSVYSQTLAATGGLAPYVWSISNGSLPVGFSISEAGVISGTAGVSGTANFTVLVTDSRLVFETKDLSITVGGSTTPVSIITASLPGATTGNAYSQNLAATGGTAPYSWSVSSGNLPAGLAISTTGLITGTPTATGTSAFTVRVTDSASGSATRSLSIVVSAATPLNITTTTLPAATLQTAYSQNLAAVGGMTPYSWSVSSGSLPAGLTISTSGTISGTPTAAGTRTFTVRVQDNAGRTDTQSLTIVVGLGTLNITTTSLPDGEEDDSYSATLRATGGSTPYTWSISSGSLPSGLTLNSSTGVISGRPTSDGSRTFTVRVRDPGGRTDTQSLTIDIDD